MLNKKKWLPLLGKKVLDPDGDTGTLEGVQMDGDLLVNGIWWGVYNSNLVKEFTDPNQTKLDFDEG